MRLHAPLSVSPSARVCRRGHPRRPGRLPPQRRRNDYGRGLLGHRACSSHLERRSRHGRRGLTETEGYPPIQPRIRAIQSSVIGRSLATVYQSPAFST